MADLFRCDHCGKVLKKHEKKGTLLLQEHTWNGGVFFGTTVAHTHDLCERCYGSLYGRIKRLLGSGDNSGHID